MTSAEGTIRLDLFTRQPVLDVGLRCVLTRECGLEICNVHREVRDLIGDLTANPPDLLLFDYLPEINAATVAEVRQSLPECKVVIWAGSMTAMQANFLVEIGVRGVIYKEMPLAALQNCLAAVAQGQTWIQRELMNSLLDVRRVRMSRRELQLLRLVSQGLGNKQIAYQLDIHEGTVKVYLSKLFRKLEVRDRFELALFGLKHLGVERDQANLHWDSREESWLRSTVIPSPRGPGSERDIFRRTLPRAAGESS